ncbi:MAG: Fic family protein [Candidatus Eisenbacteria bacterium]
MRRAVTGQYVEAATAGETVRAFVPAPLPPDPPLELGGDLAQLLDRALVALGRLDGASRHLPAPDVFLYTYVRREAVLSSQIEGTQSSLSDLLLFELDEAPGVPFDDVVEVSNYVAALQHGLDRVRAGFPLSNRLLREVHEILLSRGRGPGKQPGEFRRSQNWIGGTRPGDAHFVPPPPGRVKECMGQLERWLHSDESHAPVLVRAALAHVQFETIHPFLDGNGRVGRLLIPLLLHVHGVLHQPLLYLSLYFKTHRARYYELLDRVRTDGEWEEWIRFFAQGVEETASAAVATTGELHALAQADRVRIRGIGRVASSALQVHEALTANPLTSIKRTAEKTGLSTPAVTSALLQLSELGITREITGRKRGRVFAYSAYLDILQRGLEPL